MCRESKIVWNKTALKKASDPPLPVVVQFCIVDVAGGAEARDLGAVDSRLPAKAGSQDGCGGKLMTPRYTE